MNRILVTGSTGTLGRPVIALLHRLGADVRGLSRHPSHSSPADSPALPADGPLPAAGPRTFRGDLATGEGLEQALAGMEAVVHCASDTRRMGRTDLQATRNLLDAAGRAGHPYILFISIVGVDRIPYPYYRVKLRAEALIEAYGGGILRATQFHDFVLGGARLAARLPIALAPDVDVQPISTTTVAARIADLLDDPRPGRAPDLGGPEVLHTPDVFRSYLTAAGSHRPVLPIRLPGATFGAFRRGAHLTPHRSPGPHWSDFLQNHFPGTPTTP
ncbi:SDR family oxidoreductase [Actinoplanes utahensis]|uniref:NAD(P)-binding domain-containing protein n=1 Tax=Actinoplanes utahensis TaxID=1869 RepID=A0A0A6X6N3_ACTUT|nr:NAD(P)H-binding protein [Actinoplanes utahensis]KHD75762.1 hypothetical protein MB27_21375 [Actinoplanes utahensis]